jgi:type II secretory pathway pseudopilin PulG
MIIGCGKRSQSASTLVEVIIATSILSIMGGGIMGSINYGMFVMRLARENARATQIMLEKVESIRLYDWSQVTTPNFVPSAFTDAYDPQGAAGQQGAVYNGTISVDACPLGTSYSGNMRQFTVTLQWTTAGRINHNRSLVTYVAKDGMQNYVY